MYRRRTAAVLEFPASGILGPGNKSACRQPPGFRKVRRQGYAFSFDFRILFAIALWQCRPKNRHVGGRATAHRDRHGGAEPIVDPRSFAVADRHTTRRSAE